MSVISGITHNISKELTALNVERWAQIRIGVQFWVRLTSDDLCCSAVARFASRVSIMHGDLQPSSLILLGLAVEGITSSDGIILITAEAVCTSATCPLCEPPSRRIHSRYVRFVSDPPCTGRGIRLHLVTPLPS